MSGGVPLPAQTVTWLAAQARYAASVVLVREATAARLVPGHRETGGAGPAGWPGN